MTDQNAELRAALEGVTRLYVQLVDSGDAGNWNADAEPGIIAARSLLATPAPATVDPVAQGDVTQADRDVAAYFYQRHLSRPGEVPVARAMHLGEIDDSPLIRAFAVHRIASQADGYRRGVEDAAKIAERHIQLAWDGSDLTGSMYRDQQARLTARDIRALPEANAGGAQ